MTEALAGWDYQGRSRNLSSGVIDRIGVFDSLPKLLFFALLPENFLIWIGIIVRTLSYNNR